jgi:prevent-host-death family protein
VIDPKNSLHVVPPPCYYTTIKSNIKDTFGGIMGKVPKIIPITDLRQDAAAVMDDIQKTAEPCFITQRGRATAVLLSLEAYERSQKEKELLHLLAVGEKELAQGKGYSLESVLKDADALLENGGT